MAYEKRRYQTEAIDATLAAFAEKGRESVLLESPVGSGKTYMALEMLHRLQEKLGRPLRINWVAPRHRLLQQVMEANRDLYRDSIRPVSLFASAPPEADFVVLDEAHHEATQSCVLLYEKMRAKWTLGLSATPLRTDRMKLSFQETVRTCPIGRLIREGYLSPFNSYLIPTYSVDSVADHYLAAPEKWGKSLVFFSTIAECVAFKARLAEGGIGCEVVTGESNKDVQMVAFEEGRVPFLLLLDKITDVRNVGAIARSAECAGVDAIILPLNGGAQLNEDAVKSSAGALHKVPVCRHSNLVEVIQYLKDSGIEVIGVTEKANHAHYNKDFTGPVCLIMGNEYEGIAWDYLRHCNDTVTIPMVGTIRSLNVSVATGIALFEVVKQRNPVKE